jgi:hypothetical protein
LPGCQTVVWSPSAREQILARFLAGRPYIVIDGLSRSLSQLEPDRSACLLLPHGRSINRVTIGRDVIELEGHEIEAAELAVDCEIST